MKRSSTKVVTQLGLLIALAMICSYIETLVPAFFVVPGMKLGLTNVVVVIALYRMNSGTAMGINVIRIFLVSMLFGNMFSLIYSLAGGMLSTIIMILLKKTEKFSILAVSVAGGVFHNVGQIFAAMILLGTNQIAWYLVILWFSGIVTGALIGLLASILYHHIPAQLFE